MKRWIFWAVLAGFWAAGSSNVPAEITRRMTFSQALRDSKPEYLWTPLHWASREGNADEVRRLILGGANLEARDALNRTPLHVAAQFGHRNAALALLEGGADIQARDQWGVTPLRRIKLQEAARGWDLSEVRSALLARGARPY